jgi:hypothetical protein
LNSPVPCLLSLAFALLLPSGADAATATGGLTSPAAPRAVPVVPAQEAGEKLCGTCKTTGRVELDVNRKYDVEYEGGETWKVLFCADAIESDAMALDWAVCRRCKTPSVQATAQAEWDALAAANQEWLKERRRVDALVDADGMSHVETTHFVISWNIPKITTAKKKSYRMHDAAHLYARRMEELYARFQEMFAIHDRQNMRNKHYFYVFEKEREAITAGPVYAGLSGAGTVKRAGGADRSSVVVMWRNKSENPKEVDFHRHWIHSAIHQFTSVYRDIKWFKIGDRGLSPPWLNDKYGWIDAGLAHWFEMDLDGSATTFCLREQDASARWRGGDWRKNVWKSVKAEDAPPFPEVITKPTQALSPEEHQFAWSWVDYLLHLNTEAMGDAMRLAKQEKPTRDLLKQGWGLTTFGFETAWAEWVLVEYAPSNKEGRIDPRTQTPDQPPRRGSGR